MTEQTSRMLKDALRLPLDERAELAAELIASIDGPSEPEAEAAWAAEITRRAERARAGLSVGTDWQTVRERIDRDLLGR
jgi:putative addiction module component (TIGR02574 family)